MNQGEWVDAIESAETQLVANMQQAASLRESKRIGTGTAFVTFTTRQAALDCVAAFKDAKTAHKACGHPTYQPPNVPLPQPGAGNATLDPNPRL